MKEPAPHSNSPVLHASGELRRSLCWSRLAEPQADLYDSYAVLALMANKSSTASYVRGSSFATLRIAPVFPAAELPPNNDELYSDAELDHPCIEEAIWLLQCWPAGVSQVRLLIDSLHPGLDRRQPPILPKARIISSSHSVESRFGALWASVNSAVGLAQSIVHEMAHHKLRALGVSSERAIAVVANDTLSRYPSPLVAWKRPMTAVVHAHYALLHVAALDCALLARERSRVVRAALSRSLVRHLFLMSQSGSVIRKHLIVDAFGVSFMQAMWSWMDGLRKAARHHVQ